MTWCRRYYTAIRELLEHGAGRASVELYNQWLIAGGSRATISRTFMQSDVGRLRSADQFMVLLEEFMNDNFPDNW